MAVIGVDFSGKFPDAPPCYCVAVVLCLFFSRMSVIKSVGEEMRQLAPACVSSSGVDTPYMTPAAKTCSSWALFMSPMLSPTTTASVGLTFNFFKAVSKCTGLGLTVGTESRVTTASKVCLR